MERPEHQQRQIYFVVQATKKFQEEAALETYRVEMLAAFRDYIKENGIKGGKQTSNLSQAEARGLKSLKKRVQEGEVVIMPTDKTGKFCIMSRSLYEEAGLVHTSKDVEVQLEEVMRVKWAVGTE